MASTSIYRIDLSVDSKFDVESVQIWTEQQVHQWLKDVGNGFEEYADIFLEHNISGDILFDVRHDHLREMGVMAVGERMRILIIFKRLWRLANQKQNSRQSAKRMPQKEKSLSGSSATGLRVETHMSNSGTSTPPARPKVTSTTSQQSRFRSRTAQKSDDTIPRDSINLAPPKRAIRVFATNDQSRTLDITSVYTLRELYRRILNKIYMVKTNDLDDDRLDREMDKWELVLVEKQREGAVVQDRDVSQLGLESGSSGDGVARTVFRRKNASSGTDSKRSTNKKFAKLESFFGEKFSPVQSPRESVKAPSLSSAPPPHPSEQKLRSFFGNRPPSEMIVGNLNNFFPESKSHSTKEPSAALRRALQATGEEQLETRTESAMENVKSEAEEKVSTSLPGMKDFKWAKGTLLGTGSFGNVYMGLNTVTGEIMAVKQVPLPDDSDQVSTNDRVQQKRKQMVDALHREINLLKDLEHPNIVKYLGSESSDKFLHIFLEYVPGGTISSALAQYGVFEEGLIRNYVKQILNGLNYLHERNIVHRDIKGANILIDNNGKVKIADFGISKKTSTGQDRGSVISLVSTSTASKHKSALQGSVFWMSPEAVKHHHYTKKSDIWSLGCVVIEMLTGKHPWPELSQMQAIYKIGSGERPELPSNSPKILYEFMDQCLMLNFKDRPAAHILLKHEFLAPLAN